jgi:hypothetical protein
VIWPDDSWSRADQLYRRRHKGRGAARWFEHELDRPAAIHLRCCVGDAHIDVDPIAEHQVFGRRCVKLKDPRKVLS